MAASMRAVVCVCRLVKQQIIVAKCTLPRFSLGQPVLGFHTNGSSYGPNSNRIARRLETYLSRKKMLNPSITDQLKWVRPTVGGDVGAPGTKKKNVPPHQSTRLKIYNKIVYDHLIELFNSDVISEELYQLQVEVIAVRYNGTMTTCRVFWQPTGTAEEDNRIQNILNHYAPKIRHYLISHHILGKIPQLVFVTEKASANASEVERLLTITDMGPPEDEVEEHEAHRLSMVNDGVDGDGLSLTSLEDEIDEEVGTDSYESLFGIDHSVVIAQIKKHKEKTDAEEQFQEMGQDTDDLAKTFQQFQKDLKRQKTRSSMSSLRREGRIYRGELDKIGEAHGEMEYDERHMDSGLEEEDTEFDNYDSDEFDSHSDSDESGYDRSK